MEQNKQNSALLVMDMQSSILSRLPETSVLLSHVKKAIANAREKNIPVIYVVVGFRPGAPEISTNNKGFSANKSMLTSGNMEDMIKVHPDISPLPGEITVVKRRISAFTGSDLEVVLRAFSVQHLILTGIATSGVVLSTLREAADKDFILTVLKDGCADADEEVHLVLINKIFPRQAEVITVEEWNGRRDKF
jgi:nicotinamidase-related amidase